MNEDCVIGNDSGKESNGTASGTASRTASRTASLDCVIGLDFGTDSVRGMIINAASGEVVATASDKYRLWGEGRFCRPDLQQFRQNPTDYMMSMMKVMAEMFVGKDEYRERISGIEVDATASTVCLVGEDGSPLSMRLAHLEDPDAMFILWKDHTAQEEAEPIEEACAKASVNYIRHSGGRYSPECFWAKVYHIVKTRPELAREAYAAMDLSDWLTGCLIGAERFEDYRFGRCIAASKEMWAPEWNGLPPKEFFAQFDPELARIEGNMVSANATSDCCAGTLCKEFAEQFGLSEDVKVGYGIVDSHCGAIGSGIKEGTAIINLGTSAGIMAIMPKDKIGDSIIPGVYGQAEDLIVPGYIGYEDGLTAFGDIFAWYKRLLAYGRTAEEADSILPKLDEDAAKLEVTMRTPVAVDWLNGRRSPDPNGTLRGMIAGLLIGSTAAEVYYSLCEAACFALKRIVEHLESGKVEINEVRAAGGISRKSPFVMQLLANVLQLEIGITETTECCALGAAVNASVAAGLYGSISEAEEALCPPVTRIYAPDTGKAEMLEKRYEAYKAACEAEEKLNKKFRI